METPTTIYLVGNETYEGLQDARAAAQAEADKADAPVGLHTFRLKGTDFFERSPDYTPPKKKRKTKK